MPEPTAGELWAAEELVADLEDYYDNSEDDVEPIVPGHKIHSAVNKWRDHLPRHVLPPAVYRIWERLRKESKNDRSQAKEVASTLAEKLLEMYPKLAPDDAGARGEWFAEPPPRDADYVHGPISGTMTQLADWMGMNYRTLKKHNGKVGFWIQKEHGKRCLAWFNSRLRFDEANKRRQENHA